MPNVFVMTLITCWFSTGECVTRVATFETVDACVAQVIARTIEYSRDGIDFAQWSCKITPEVSV